jgi:D-lactate dehydrogenase (cytochrome)
MSAAICSFDSLQGAVQTTIDTIQSGAKVARIELLDDLQVKIVNAYSHLDLAEENMLFIEFHGTPASVQEQAEMVQELATANGGKNFVWKTAQEDRNILWRARHNVAYSCKAFCPGKEIRATDVCVPISRLAECILETKADIEQTNLVAPIVGHVGDGNFHVTIMVDPHDTAEVAESDRLNEKLVKRAIEMDGTCSGEHGIGTGKRKYLKAEHGNALHPMYAIKHALDPKNIMNPGKILPDVSQ